MKLSALKQWLKTQFPWLPRWAQRLMRNRVYYLVHYRRVLAQLAQTETASQAQPLVFVFSYTGAYPKRLQRSLQRQNYPHWKLQARAALCPLNDNTWVCNVTHDITLAKGALAWLAQQLPQWPQAQAVYADHVERRWWGGFYPHCKPAWSPHYFAAFDYIGPALWLRAHSLQVLEAPEQVLLNLPAAQVLHAPVPLMQAFTALTAPRTVPLSVAQPTEPVRSLAIIIPTRNALHLLEPCVSSVLSSLPAADECQVQIVVVDNQSDCPQTLDYLASFTGHPTVRVLRYNQPFNFSALNNWAAQQCEADALLFLNNDTEVRSTDWLSHMLQAVQQPNVGCVGTKLLYPNGLVQHAGVVMGYGGGADHTFKFAKANDAGYMHRANTPQNYSAVTAACLMVRRQVFEHVQEFDESLQVAFNDVDFCLKVQQAGYHNLWLPNAILLHYESPSRGQDNTPEKQQRFAQELATLQQRWHGVIANDPGYNPWLALTRHDFAYTKKRLSLQQLDLRVESVH